MRSRPLATAGILLIASFWSLNRAQQPDDPPLLESPLRPTVGSAWQLQWSSLAGRTYQLQRSHDLNAWTEVATVTATGPATMAADAGVHAEQRTFWRVIRLGTGPDLLPPTLSVIQARRLVVDGQPVLELTVQARDDVGVTEVGFVETGDAWVGAAPVAGRTFVRTFPFDPTNPQPRQFQARASDAAGNVGFSEVFAFAPVAPVPGLRALGLGGDTPSQALVGRRADGSLTPFVYVPDDRAGASPEANGQFVFPEGARVVVEGDRTYLEYRSLQFRFGRQSALQIGGATPNPTSAPSVLRLAGRTPRLAATGGTALDDVLSIELPEGETARLPLGSVTVAQLEQAFGLPAGSGLPVQLFGRFPLRLLAGTLSDNRIRGANWGLDRLGLPLPPFTGSWADSVFDLLTPGEVRFPFFGELPLRALGDDAPILRVAKSRPVVLTLRADGEVALDGPASLEFADGKKFHVGVTLDDPKYCLSLRAESLTVPLVDSLADLLPSDPAACIPALSTDAALDSAEACLLALRRAYAEFTQAALTVRPDHPADGSALLPPETVDALTAIANAWIALALTPAIQTLPLQELRDLAAHLGQSARGASDTRTAAHYLAALAHLRAAVDAYAARTPPNGDEIPAVRAELNEAITLATDALAERSRDPEAFSSLVAARASLQSVHTVRELAASFAADELARINAARDRIVDGYWAKFTAGLGIQPNVFNHDDNPVVDGLDRFTALETVGRLSEFLGDAQEVGRDPESLPVLEETVEQLFGRAFEVVFDDFDAGLTAEDVPAALVALRELLDIIAFWDLLALDDGDEDFPTLADAGLLLVEVSEIVERQIGLPRDQQSLLDNGRHVRALLGVLEAVPPTTEFPFAAITSAHADLQQTLGTALTLALVNTNLVELGDILRAGTLSTRFGLRFGLTNAVDWEATHLPAMVQRLGDVALQQKATAPLDQAIRFLLDEGDQLEADAARLAAAGSPAANTRQASRRLYYLRAADLLARSRELARSLWLEAEQRRALDPEGFSADAFLPGDLKVDAIAGSVCFNHATGDLSGAFNGRLRLPKFDSALTIANASLSNRGDFDLDAHGQLQLPAGSPAATLIVPPRQPLHVSHSARTGLAIAGKARLQFPNGVFFEAGLDFADPLYSMELAAGGIEVDLARTLASLLPLGLEPADLANLARGQLWSDYFRFLTACVETGYRPENEIDAQIPGTLPAFSGRAAADLSCLLDAWSCLMLAEAERGSLERYRSTYEKIGEILSLLDGGLQEGLEGFATLFGPANEFEIGFQLRRLEKLALTYAKVGRALHAIGERDPTGAQAFDLARVKSHLDHAAALWLGVANKLDDNVDLLRNRDAVRLVVRAGLDLVATYQLLGLDDDTGAGSGLGLPQVRGFLDVAADEIALAAGLDRATGQINAARIAGFTYDQARERLREHLDLVADLQIAGINESVSTPFLAALLGRQRELALADLGFDVASNQFNLDLATEATIQRGILRLAPLPAAFASAGVSGPVLPPAFATLSLILRGRLLERHDALPVSRWPARKALLFAVLRLEELRQFAGLGSFLEPGVNLRLLVMLEQMLAEGRGRLSRDEQEVLEFLAPGLAANVDWRTPIRNRLAAAAAALDAETTSAWTDADLSRAPALAAEFLALHRLSRLDPSVHLTGAHTGASVLGSLTGRLETAGRAFNRARPLSEVADLWLEAADQIEHLDLAAELHGRARQLLNAARDIAAGYGPKLDNLDEADAPADLHLPQDLVVRRVFGSVFYRRDNGFLRGTFGGRLDFPNEKAFFEITRASLDNQGGFELLANTQFPLRPTGDDRVEITASLDVAGNATTLSRFTGTGQLALKESPTTTRTYAVGVAYDGTAPARPLRFTTSLDGAPNAEAVRFSDDFVLFGGNLVAELSLANQGDFTLGFGGRAGFFSRRTPLTDPVRKEDFWVYADIDQLAVRRREAEFVATFAGGSLTLAEDVFEALEELPGGEFLPTDEPVTVPIPFAFSVGYDFAEGRPVFALGNADAASVALAAPGGSQPVVFDLPPLAFGIPGLTNANLRVASSRLEFSEDRFPILRNLDARFTFPLPGADFTDPAEHGIADVQLTGVNWRIDGFPDAAAIGLGQDLRLVNTDAFDLDLLAGTAMGFESALGSDGARHTSFTLTGGVRGTLDGDLVFDADTNAAFAFATTGTFRWDSVNVPTFDLGTVTFSGRLKLGGADGFELLGVDSQGIPDTDNPASLASISLTGLPNLFQLGPNRLFEIRVSGALGSDQFLYFGLGNARFVFDGIATAANPEPQFSVQSLGFKEGEQLSLMGIDALPFRVTSGSITFLDPARPLDQLFAITNLQFTLGGEINLSLASPDAEAPATPRLFGAVENVVVSLPEGFSGPPRFSLDTFVLTLENLTIGDLAGLTGGLAVGNLQNPAELFFAGTAGGGFNGVAIKAIVATRLTGLIGVCLDVNAGPAGIPLDGGSLGGILLTGAQGGVSFANEFADPCDFKSYLRLAADGTPTTNAPPAASPSPRALASLASHASSPAAAAPVIPVSHLPVLTWEELARQQALHEERKAVRALLGTADRTVTANLVPPSAPPRPNLARASLGETPPTSLRLHAAPADGGDVGEDLDIACPTGDCPPPTINLLCQRHPSVDEEPSDDNYDGRYRNRVIFKFSSLDRASVDDLLAALDLDLSGSTSVVAGRFADGTRDLIDGLIPRPGAGVPAQQAQALNAHLDHGLDAMREVLFLATQEMLALAAGEGRTPLEAIYEAAYAGVPCLDLTLQLKGTFSYSPISAALSATGGAVVSTTGSAGVLGSINLFGIPVGTGEFFYSLTDANGAPNPSLCGGARIALGPLDLSRLDLAIGCDDCITGTLEALAGFISGLTGELLNQAGPIVYAYIEHAAGTRVAGIRERPLAAYFGPPSGGALLTREEQVAVLAALLNLPEIARFLEANPGAVTEFNRDALSALAAHSLALVLEIYQRAEPRLSFCGEIEPKLFGFSLTGGNTLAAARFAADKTRLAGDVSFSPSYIFGNLPFFLLSSGSLANVVPALDEATMGFSLGMPLFDEEVLLQLGNDPAGFASTQVDHLLANAVMTFGYELSPFGFKIADGEGRVILPTVEDHPGNPARRAARPADYDVQGRFVPPSFPDRDAILEAALDANQLAKATWNGRDGQLAALFPAESPQAQALAGRELARDYFPHGGFLGAAKVQFPKPITDAPPVDRIQSLVAAETDLLQRLDLALDLFNNYLLGSREIGQLLVYVPFPQPPETFWSATRGPRAFLDAITGLTPERLLDEGLSLYPAEQLFMRGAVHASLLGLPVAEGELVADPAQGLFRLSAGVPTGTWLEKFVGGSLEFEIRSAAYLLGHDPTRLPPGVTAADLQPEARLQAALALLQAAAQPAATTTQRQAAIQTAIDRITDTLPKVALNTRLDLALPDTLGEVLRFESGAGFHAFSPRFEPDYAGPGFTGTILYPDPDPANPGPYTLARRNGGIVAVGHFHFGFNLDDPDPSRRLVINVPEAALAVTGASDPSLFPALAGRLRVEDITLPGAFRFNGTSTPPFVFRNGLLQFNSAPPANGDFLAIAGALTPIDLGPFLRVRPLPTPSSSPDNLLGGTLRITRTDAGPTFALDLDAAAVSVPLLGQSLRGTIFGSEPAPGRFTPFRFSTVPGQSWRATLRLEGPLEIRSPLDPAGPVVFRAQPLTVRGAPFPFEAELRGEGLDTFEIRLTIPNGLAFTLFPGADHESRFTTGDNSATCLQVRSDGRIYFDSGTRTLDLRGLATATGRIEFGFEPVDRTPILARSALAAFSSRLGGSVEQTLRITNANPQGGQLVVDAAANDPTHFFVLPNRLILGPGESRSLSIRFTPKQAGTFSRQLTLSNNSAQPLITVPLTAGAITAPRLHVSLASISFGATPLGTSRSQAIRVSNLGDAPLSLAGIKTATPRFAGDRTTLTVPAGQARDLVVRFTPTGTALVSDSLTFTSNDPDAPSGTVALNGSGSDRFWYRQRRGTGHEHLRAIAMKANDQGFAAGQRGAFLRADGRGRLWREDFFADAPNLRALLFTSPTVGWLAGDAGTVFRTANGGTTWSPQTAKDLADDAFHWRALAVLDRAAGSIAFAGQAKEAGRVVFGPNASSLAVGVVPDKTPPLSGIAFGTPQVGLAVGEQATVLRTTDGGKSWQRLGLPAAVPSTAHLRAVAFNDANTANYVVVGDDGLILRTSDSGATWTVRASSTTEDLHAVIRVGSAFYAAGDRGVLRRAPNSGLTWSAEDARTNADFRALATDAGEIWAASAEGDIFQRRTLPIGGPLAVVAAGDLDFGEVRTGETLVGEVTVGNEGTQPLTLDVTTGDPKVFTVLPAGTVTVPPGCAATFAIRFAFPGGKVNTSVSIASNDDLTAKLELPLSATEGKHESFTDLAYALIPACLDLGTVAMGDAAKAELVVENLGSAPLQLHGLTPRDDDPPARFDIEPTFGTLAPGAKGVVALGITPLRAGPLRTQLEFVSDARNAVVLVEVVGEAVAAPEVTVIDSVPRGAVLRVNGVPATTPAAFTLVDGTPAPGQFRRGTTVNLEAPTSHGADGVTYAFQRWEPGRTGILSFIAGQGASRFTARYAQTLPAGPPVSAAPVVKGTCEFDPPADVAFGPWVKISQARLTLPWLGEGAGGSDFNVDGALFLSLPRAYGSLTSSRVRVRVPSNAPHFAGTELLEITPGAWNFDVQSGFLRLSSRAPGLEVLGASALPPATLEFEVDVRASSANRRAFARFATLDELPIAPGLLAVGPATAEVRLGLDPAQPDARLTLGGSLRAIARPGGGWILDRNYTLALDASAPGLAPLRFDTRTLLADLAIVRLHAEAGAEVGPTLVGSTFGVTATQLSLEFFDNGQPVTAGATFLANGNVDLSAGFPNGLDAGPVRLLPHPSGTGTLTLSVNPLQGRLAVQLPRLHLNADVSPKPWADHTIEIPGFGFDGANFAVRVPLPSLDFAGLDLDAGTTGADADNHFEFSRGSGGTRISVRNRQDLYLGAMQFGFTVDGGGSVSGHLSGRIGVDAPAPLDQFGDRISMAYRRDRDPEFVHDRFIFGIGCRLSVGSKPPFAQACVLTPNLGLPIEEWTADLCLP